MIFVVRVLTAGAFSVHVYAEYGERHHLPHCQVRWSDGDCQVALPSLRVLAGKLPAAGRRILVEHLNEICKAWDELNPERTTR
jgi:hypothetical protein